MTRLQIAATAALALALCAGAANGQTPAPRATGATAASGNVEVHGSPVPASDADVYISAHVHIDSMTVQSSGTNRFNVTLKPGQSGWTLTRKNVPAKLQNGKTYKNVDYNFTASGMFLAPSPGPSLAPFRNGGLAPATQSRPSPAPRASN